MRGTGEEVGEKKGFFSHPFPQTPLIFLFSPGSSYVTLLMAFTLNSPERVCKQFIPNTVQNMIENFYQNLFSFLPFMFYCINSGWCKLKLVIVSPNKIVH